MKTVYLLTFALCYLSVSAQDVCPCQENNYQFSQYSWNQMETSDLETAYIIPEKKVITLQLVSEQEPIIETPPPVTPKIEERPPAQTTAVNSIPPVRATSVSSNSRSGFTSGKKPRRPNPRFRKSKRKGKKKYKGTCPKI